MSERISINRRHFLQALSIAGVLSLAPAAIAASGEHGTREGAQALVEEAIGLLRSEGAEALAAEVNAPNTRFLKGDLYVFVVGPEGRTIAHGFDQSRVGLDLSTLVDGDGKAYGKELLAATEEGSWVDYKWKDPLTGMVEPKSTWAKKVDDYIIACGVYMPN